MAILKDRRTQWVVASLLGGCAALIAVSAAVASLTNAPLLAVMWAVTPPVAFIAFVVAVGGVAERSRTPNV